MFTWICPQCGKEVPPSYSDCPDCAKRAAAPAGVAAPAPPAYAPPPPAYAPPPPPAYAPPAQQQYYQPPPPGYYPPQQQMQPPQQQAPPYYPPQPPPPAPPQQQAPPQAYYAPAPARAINLPVWAMTLLVALGIGVVVFGLIKLLSSNHGSAGSGPGPTAAVESPAAKPGAKTNPLQKYIEVAGVRFVTDPGKGTTMVKFVLINHSPADINGLAGNVTMWGSTRKSEEDVQGSFSFTTTLAPFESKELSVPLNTKHKVYELADWQNISTDVQITAPAG